MSDQVRSTDHRRLKLLDMLYWKNYCKSPANVDSNSLFMYKISQLEEECNREKVTQLSYRISLSDNFKSQGDIVENG